MEDFLVLGFSSLSSIRSGVDVVLVFDVSDGETFGGSEGEDSEVFRFVAEGVEVGVDVEGLFKGVRLVFLVSHVPDFDGSVLLAYEQVLSFLIRVHGDDSVVEGLNSSVEGEFVVEDSDFGVPGADSEEGVLSLSDVADGGDPPVELVGGEFVFSLNVPQSEGLVHSS